MDVGERRKEHETQKETKNPCKSDSDLVVAFWEHDTSLIMGSHGCKMKKILGRSMAFLDSMLCARCQLCDLRPVSQPLGVLFRL